jgi:hypothetical protein
MMGRRPPGEVRDAIVGVLREATTDMSVREIQVAVEERIGLVPPSSIRSYLRLNLDSSNHRFTKVSRGRYQIRDR